MSKGIIVLDKIPDRCECCPVETHLEKQNGNEYGHSCPFIYAGFTKRFREERRSEWCPIKPISEENVQNDNPNDEWFSGNSEIRPHDKQLCVVIPKDKEIDVDIFQYRNKIFINICALQMMGITDCVIHMDDIDRWKPLGLPQDVNERILAEIERWFEEE